MPGKKTNEQPQTVLSLHHCGAGWWSVLFAALHRIILQSRQPIRKFRACWANE